MTEQISMDQAIANIRSSDEYTTQLEKAARPLNVNAIFHKYDETIGLKTQREDEAARCEYDATDIMNYAMECLKMAMTPRPTTLTDRVYLNATSDYYRQARDAFIAAEIIATYNDKFRATQETRFSR